jgi:hypothetical protein
MTILWYDPLLDKKRGYWSGGRWIKMYSNSDNPGVWPEYWGKLSKAEKAADIKLFKEKKKGIFSEDPTVFDPGAKHHAQGDALEIMTDEDLKKTAMKVTKALKQGIVAGGDRIVDLDAVSYKNVELPTSIKSGKIPRENIVEHTPMMKAAAATTKHMKSFAIPKMPLRAEGQKEHRTHLNLERFPVNVITDHVQYSINYADWFPAEKCTYTQQTKSVNTSKAPNLTKISTVARKVSAKELRSEKKAQDAMQK